MNKLADELNAPGASQDQPAPDFYARITPEAVEKAFCESVRLDVAYATAHDVIRGPLNGVGPFRKFQLQKLIVGLLAMLESAERRSAEADKRARDECAEICGRFHLAVNAANAIRETITHGNLSENRETLARGDLPHGGAA